MMTLQQLKEFAEKAEIILPAAVTRRQIVAAIAAAHMNRTRQEPDAEIGCFGFHDRDNGNCLSCVYADECSEATLGVSRKVYDTFIVSKRRIRFGPTRKNHRRPKSSKR